MIELDDKWTRQPQGVRRIDRSHPLARGLTAAFEAQAGKFVDVLNTPQSATVDTQSLRPSAAGTALVGDGTNYVRYANNNARYGSVPPFTLAAYLVRRGTLTQYRRVVENGALRSPNTSGWDIDADASNGLVFIGWPATNISTTTGPLPLDTPTLLVWSVNAGGIATYVDGVQSSSNAATNYFSATDGAFSLLRILSDEHSPTANVDIVSARIWASRALSAADVKALYSNYWQIYAKRPKRVFVTAGGSAASTIAAASGASTASTLTGSSTASTTIAGASGASTASTLAASSVAVSTAAAASGASTAQTLSGLSVTVAAISAASGATTAATIAGSSTAATTASAANGAATASTLAGASTAVSTLSAASGVSTASTLTGVAGSGSTIGVADGVSTAATITASSVAVSTISASSGASSDQIIVGAAFAEAAISGASGASTCSTLTGGNAAGLAAIEVAAGISSAQIIVGSSFAAAAIAAATGVATCSTMTGLGGADAEEAYPLRGTTPSYPLSGLESSALSDAQTYPLQGLTQE